MIPLATKLVGGRLVLPVPPTSNMYWKAKAVYSAAKKKWVGSIYKTTEAKEYCDGVRNRAFLAGCRSPYPKGVQVVFNLVWYRENMRGDLMNREKCVEDALQGIMYANDSQIKQKRTEWQLDKENPRIEVWVEVWDAEGR